MAGVAHSERGPSTYGVSTSSPFTTPTPDPEPSDIAAPRGSSRTPVASRQRPGPGRRPAGGCERGRPPGRLLRAGGGGPDRLHVERHEDDLFLRRRGRQPRWRAIFVEQAEPTTKKPSTAKPTDEEQQAGGVGGAGGRGIDDRGAAAEHQAAQDQRVPGSRRASVGGHRVGPSRSRDPCSRAPAPCAGCRGSAGGARPSRPGTDMVRAAPSPSSSHPGPPGRRRDRRTSLQRARPRSSAEPGTPDDRRPPTAVRTEPGGRCCRTCARRTRAPP